MYKQQMDEAGVIYLQGLLSENWASGTRFY